MKGHIDVDLDGTLAFYNGWNPDGSIGDPIPGMVEKIKEKRRQGVPIHIFTARAFSGNKDRDEQIARIKKWCRNVFREEFHVTAEKDLGTMEIWDDRAKQVMKNTGKFVGE
jgi:hydroxymethylpyrimidine pyrophosphatase-like HAD family hydrolase